MTDAAMKALEAIVSSELRLHTMATRLQQERDEAYSENAGLCERISALESEVATAKQAAFDAFVAGGKWWEYVSQNATMWQSDQNKMAEEAQKRYPFTPLEERIVTKEVSERIAALEAVVKAARQLDYAWAHNADHMRKHDELSAALAALDAISPSAVSDEVHATTS